AGRRRPTDVEESELLELSRALAVAYRCPRCRGLIARRPWAPGATHGPGWKGAPTPPRDPRGLRRAPITPVADRRRPDARRVPGHRPPRACPIAPRSVSYTVCTSG